MTSTAHPAYSDSDGNTYHVQKASNGMHVCVRVNPGGHRKRFKALAACRKRETAERLLMETAEIHGWAEAGKEKV